MGTAREVDVAKCPSCGHLSYDVEYNDYGGPEFIDCSCSSCGFELSTGTGSGIWEEEIYANRKDGVSFTESELSRLILCKNPNAACNGAEAISLS